MKKKPDDWFNWWNVVAFVKVLTSWKVTNSAIFQQSCTCIVENIHFILFYFTLRLVCTETYMELNIHRVTSWELVFRRKPGTEHRSEFIIRMDNNTERCHHYHSIIRYLGIWSNSHSILVNGVHPVKPLATGTFLKTEVIHCTSFRKAVIL